MMKCLVTGANGQDGKLLIERLLGEGSFVVGSSRTDPQLVHSNFQWAPLDLLDEKAVLALGETDCFDEVYHLGGETFVPAVEQNPVRALAINVASCELLMRGILSKNPSARFFLASSAAIFGNVASSPQTEKTAMCPSGIYGLTKVAVRHLAQQWRARGHHVSCGILYNHESRLRRPDFVTKKIVLGAQAIAEGVQEKLELGNLETVRDWSYAGDFLEGFQLAVRTEKPDDYIFASGEGHSVREFCEVAFATHGLDYRDYVVTNPDFYRPAERYPLIGDSSHAQNTLGWDIQMSFEELVSEVAQPC